MKKGERKIEADDIIQAIAENEGCANAMGIMENLEKLGIKTTYVTARKRAEELEDDGVLIGDGYRTGKGSRKRYWRVRGHDNETEGHR